MLTRIVVDKDVILTVYVRRLFDSVRWQPRRYLHDDGRFDALSATDVGQMVPRSVSRRSQHIPDEPAIAVVVQHMIDSERAGIAFSMNPITGERGEVVVEAAYGQGEIVVSGRVEPDTYTVAKVGPRIVDVHVGHKTTKIVRGPDGHDRTLSLEPPDTDHQVLSDDEVVEVARLAMVIEGHYSMPMDIEWAFAGGRLWLLQARPVTALGSLAKGPLGSAMSVSTEGVGSVGATGASTAAEPGGPTSSDAALEPTLLLRGLGVSPGIASGIVRVLQSPSEGAALLPGEILVAPVTNPDWAPTMHRSGAIVTESGGATCHAAILSREMGVPCIVGARDATRLLTTGQMVTIDGRTGRIVAGLIAAPSLSTSARATRPEPEVTGRVGSEAIGTLLYLNVALPEQAEAAAARDVDGVGLLRAEFMLTDALGGCIRRNCWPSTAKKSSLPTCRHRCYA